MVEHPILFSAPMVRAILAGTKTQTRRVVEPARLIGATDAYMTTPEGQAKQLQGCRFGVPGDRLWVRETCRGEELPDGLDGVRYLADSAFRPIENTEAAIDPWMKLHHYRGQRAATVPGIHMPRWASRITLEITDVRVGRLQAISLADVISEGVDSCAAWKKDEPVSSLTDWRLVDKPRDWPGVPGERFARLWESINGAGSWAANPWIWAISFQRVESDHA